MDASRVIVIGIKKVKVFDQQSLGKVQLKQRSQNQLFQQECILLYKSLTNRDSIEKILIRNGIMSSILQNNQHNRILYQFHDI